MKFFPTVLYSLLGSLPPQNHKPWFVDALCGQCKWKEIWRRVCSTQTKPIATFSLWANLFLSSNETLHALTDQYRPHVFSSDSVYCERKALQLQLWKCLFVRSYTITGMRFVMLTNLWQWCHHLLCLRVRPGGQKQVARVTGGEFAEAIVREQKKQKVEQSRSATSEKKQRWSSEQLGVKQ